MGAADAALWIAARITHELALFSGVLFAIGGLDDLLIDLIWLLRGAVRRLTVYRSHPRADAANLTVKTPGTIAVFVPAWREAGVIGRMLHTALGRWGDEDFLLYVGCYPNDRETLAQVQAVRDPRIRLVINPRPGGTTKGDNLNAMWRAMLADEAAEGRRMKAIVLHDAEDVVHPGEIAVYQALSERFDLVQLPVLPLIDERHGLWARVISAVYADSFAEGHCKTLVVREAIGAGVPSAGVGCAFSRTALERVERRFGAPFDEHSLTEDYELGLRIREMAGRGVFVRIPSDAEGGIVAVRAHFPHTFDAAVRQLARWQTGIALSGWRRLGWGRGAAEWWMRMRDRRTILSALVLFCAYLSLGLWMVLMPLRATPAFTVPELQLFTFCTTLMLWRLGMRALIVTRVYGWAEGIASLPRTLIGNFIAMAAARKALQDYLRLARGGPLTWDKTDHDFPDAVPTT